MISEQLQKKIDRSIKLLQGVANGYDGVIEVAYSGGKDSDVILQLAKESGINYRAIYRNTTIDPPGTIAHVRKMGAEVLQPKASFFQLITKYGLPNRFNRFCCKYLKEYKVLDKCIMGVRKAESVKRMARYSEPTECRWYGAKKEENHVEAIYPILEWTDEDVRDFILDRKMTLAPIYYNGGVDLSQRLGCMCCPMASVKKRVAYFKQHPRMVKAYLRAAQKYRDTHPNVKTMKKYDNVYEWVARDIFYPKEKEWQNACNTLFGKPDFKVFLEQQFGIDLTLNP